MSAKFKKGGRIRQILTGAAHAAGFEVPAGFYIDSIYAERDSASGNLSAGNIVIGTAYTPPVVAEKEVIRFTFTHAATGAGNITITLRDAASTVAIANLDAIGAVATKVATAFAVNADWTAVALGDAVTFTAKVAGAKTGSNTFVDTGTTGVTAAAVDVRNTGVDAVAAIVGNQIVTSAALSTSNHNVTKLTLVSAFFSMSADQAVYVGLTGGAICNLYVVMQKIN